MIDDDKIWINVVEVYIGTGSQLKCLQSGISIHTYIFKCNKKGFDKYRGIRNSIGEMYT